MAQITLEASPARAGWRRLALEAAASVAFALAFFLLWPTRVISDDGAIVLRYLDNFAKGYFYSYNPSDGPVFGVSGFLHCLLAGGLAYTHLLSPLHSLLFSDYFGLALVSFVCLRLLARYTSEARLIVPLWLFVMLSAPNFMTTVNIGLETPLHIAIVLACVLFFLDDSPRRMWFACALAVISKLDAAPIVLALGGAHLVRHATSLRSPAFVRRLVGDAVIFGALPVAAWAVFAYRVFGSPLPLPVYAKFFEHQPTPSQTWFPFVRVILAGDHLFAWILAPLVLAYLLYWVAVKRDGARTLDLVFGLILLAQLALYYVYNPPEPYPWYYALPEFLIGLQIAVLVCVFLEAWLPKRTVAAGWACCVALALIAWPQVSGLVRASVAATSVVETERMAVGRWVNAHSRPSDVLFAGHGHVAREARIYTVDYTGLNSKVALDDHLNLSKMIVDLKPNWIVQHGLLDPGVQVAQGYRLVKSFYNITTFGFPTWRIFERETAPAPCAAVALAQGTAETDGGIEPKNGFFTAVGTRVEFRGFAPSAHRVAFILGLQKTGQKLLLNATVSGPDQVVLDKAEFTLDPEDPANPAGGITGEWRIELDPSWEIASIVITSQDEAGAKSAAILSDPVFIEIAGSSAAAACSVR